MSGTSAFAKKASILIRVFQYDKIEQSFGLLDSWRFLEILEDLKSVKNTENFSVFFSEKPSFSRTSSHFHPKTRPVVLVCRPVSRLLLFRRKKLLKHSEPQPRIQSNAQHEKGRHPRIERNCPRTSKNYFKFVPKGIR